MSNWSKWGIGTLSYKRCKICNKEETFTTMLSDLIVSITQHRLVRAWIGMLLMALPVLLFVIVYHFSILTAIFNYEQLCNKIICSTSWLQTKPLVEYFPQFLM